MLAISLSSNLSRNFSFLIQALLKAEFDVQQRLAAVQADQERVAAATAVERQAQALKAKDQLNEQKSEVGVCFTG